MVARALKLIGDRWSFMLMREALFHEVRRFDDFQENLGIARNVLTARLKKLVADLSLDKMILVEAAKVSF